ncbi:MAG: hypothetical protein EBS29_03990 [Chloroflexia bacterium]|nr:hypothetical protein [Chloroflexia bacterium]
MEITTVFGLPAHPLFVHAPLVLVPLAVLVGGIICMGVVTGTAIRVPELRNLDTPVEHAAV